MWNKSNNSSEEIIDFLLQDLWNNIFLKNVDVDHKFIANFFKEVKNLLKDREKRQP